MVERSQACHATTSTRRCAAQRCSGGEHPAVRKEIKETRLDGRRGRQFEWNLGPLVWQSSRAQRRTPRSSKYNMEQSLASTSVPKIAMPLGASGSAISERITMKAPPSDHAKLVRP